MEQRISLITLGVADIPRSRAFYVDGLGWRPVFEHDEIVFFQMNAIIVGLFQLDSFAKDAHVDRATLKGGGMALAYNTRDRAEVDLLLERAEQAGARRPAPAEEKFWGGYSGYFVDPDGHLWEIAWNPTWQLDEKGNVTFG